MATSNSQTQTQIQGRQMVFSRVFSAPRERVFKAWTDCDALTQWWGPREWPLTH